MRNIYEVVLAVARDKQLKSSDVSGLVAVVLAALTPVQRQVVELRFGLGGTPDKTLQEVGDELGLTRERVRQIIVSVKEKLHRAMPKEYSEFLGLIRALLEDAGGFLAESELIIRVLTEAPELKEENALKFLLFIDGLERIEKKQVVRPSWSVPTAPYSLVEDFCLEVERVLAENKKSMELADLLLAVKKSAVYKKNAGIISDEYLVSIIYSAARVAKGLGEEFGLVSWAEIKPKSIPDKIFWVMRKYARPMHFKEIARSIEAEKFVKAKKYTEQAIHNELIADARFVLIGRGIYALAQWGYKAGTVADVIAEVMHESAKPLTETEVVREVLKRREVEEATVLFNLKQRKSEFAKTTDGKWTLSREQVLAK